MPEPRHCGAVQVSRAPLDVPVAVTDRGGGYGRSAVVDLDVVDVPTQEGEALVGADLPLWPQGLAGQRREVHAAGSPPVAVTTEPAPSRGRRREPDGLVGTVHPRQRGAVAGPSSA